MQKKKLSVWAKENGTTPRTAWFWIKNGTFPGQWEKTPSGRYFIIEGENTPKDISNETVIYCRVSNHSRKEELNYQVKRCTDFCIANGWCISATYKEVASGMNDERKELWRMINKCPKRIVIENKDRLTRFGFTYLKRFLEKQGTEIIIINSIDNDSEELIKDFASVIYSFCARLYGLRRAANKATKIKEEILEKE